MFYNLKVIDLGENKIDLGFFAENGTYFPNLNTLDFSKTVGGSAGLLSLAKNGSKFPNLHDLIF